jgi:DNA-directed RNA polymerase specialized sigma24 family protein
MDHGPDSAGAAGTDDSADTGETIALVKRAKLGDREAWATLLALYHERWIQRYHGELGTTVRRLYDTDALVQSAIADAIRDISRLKDESVFFVWVSSILRHKLALRHRQNRRYRPLDGVEPAAPAAAPANGFGEVAVEFSDTYLHTLEAIIAAFDEEPRWMAALVLRHLDGLEPGDVARRLGVSRRTAYHWTAAGKDFLSRRLRRGSEGGA